VKEERRRREGRERKRTRGRERKKKKERRRKKGDLKGNLNLYNKTCNSNFSVFFQ